jgi:hypothetical protein
MAEAPTHVYDQHRIAPLTAHVLAGAGTGELVGGSGALVLSILALAGIIPIMLLPIAGLCVGGALMFEGGTIASRFRELLGKLDNRIDMAELGGGLSAEFLGGAAGVVLGILALLGLHPLVLMSASAIVYGGALVIGSGVTAEMKSLTVPGEDSHPRAQLIAREAISAAAGLRVLAGLGSITLGILGIVSVGPEMPLALVAFLGLGGTLLLSGTAIGGKMLAVFQH